MDDLSFHALVVAGGAFAAVSGLLIKFYSAKKSYDEKTGEIHEWRAAVKKDIERLLADHDQMRRDLGGMTKEIGEVGKKTAVIETEMRNLRAP